MGRSDEQGDRPLTVAEEFSLLLGIELESPTSAPEAWEAQAEAEASIEAKQDADSVQKEEATTYAKEQGLTAYSLWIDEEEYSYIDVSKGK